MIVVLSVINGFETEMRDRFLAANAHILLYKFPSGLEEPERWLKSVKEEFSEDITGASPFVHMETMAKNNNILNSVLVRGIHPSKREKVQPLRKLIRPQAALETLEKEITDPESTEYPSIILGIGLARLLQLEQGQYVGLISPLAEDPLSAVTRFKIAGIYDSGLSHYDNKLAILSIPSAQKLFRMKNIVTGLEIGMKDPWQSPDLSKRLSIKYRNTSVKQWQGVQQNYV